MDRQPAAATELARAGEESLIERWFPYWELSQIAQADRRAKDPKYAAHVWWARRPPGVFRGILLATALDPETPSDLFWEAFASDRPSLCGLRVEDPFAGGGTTAMEASRLGATAIASDIDPLAIEIIRHQLATPLTAEVEEAGRDLIASLNRTTKQCFKTPDGAWLPLHYFYIREVTCPACGDCSPLYRDRVIARNPRKVGSVKRDFGLVAFCSVCFHTHELSGHNRRALDCCGIRQPLYEGTFEGQSFVCPRCGHKAQHRDLQTGAAPRRLVAVEETPADGKGARRFRDPHPIDHQCMAAAARKLKRDAGKLDIPDHDLRSDRADDRPRSYGITSVRELFTERQLVVFGGAFRWLREATHLAEPTRRAIALATSSALASNNVLCGYARDYGRLSALFSVRGYSLPALAVELNPLHPFAGRGTLVKTLERVKRSTSEVVRRSVWVPELEKTRLKSFSFDRTRTASTVILAPATRARHRAPLADICVFDPPYFDYISYDELSEFYRAWLGKPSLAGVPLLPAPGDQVASFALHLSKCIAAIERRLAQGRPLVFTFHSASGDAWKAIGAALDQADMMVTALWPIKTDGHMGHHSHDGNCEWDILVVCRTARDCTRATCSASADRWVEELAGLEVSAVDQEGMRLAVDMARMRFGRLHAR